jgi:N-acetylglucosaminyldiphosphoundecaprenol N-acetyl-beta-D-mannosaminyltransferase
MVKASHVRISTRSEDEVQTFQVLDTPIGLLTMSKAIDTVLGWLKEDGPCRLVTFANVHMVVEARLRPEFGDILRQTDLNCPDGSPLSWIGSALHGDEVSQVPGPEFMPLFCEQTANGSHRHFLYGGGPRIAEKAALELTRHYPGIQIAGYYSPPFRQLTPEEDEQICGQINQSGADIVWVCLGCPKQEKWIVEHRDRLNAKVVLAVGQAFDIVAGVRPRAPRFFRKFGMEWAYRLIQEPRRLSKRYLFMNALFIAWMLPKLIRGEISPARALET